MKFKQGTKEMKLKRREIQFELVLVFPAELSPESVCIHLGVS